MISFEETLEILRCLRQEHDVQKINFSVYRSAVTLTFSQGKVYRDKADKKIKLFEDEYKKIIDYLETLNLLDLVKLNEDKITIEFYIKNEGKDIK